MCSKDAKEIKIYCIWPLIDIALRYEREALRNDTEPFKDILGKLTSEIEDALK